MQRDGVRLIYRDASDALTPDARLRIIDTFFSAYLSERRDFNPMAADRVTIVIDPTYDGVANTDHALMTINPAWLVKKPGDTDLVTHEAMHIVQAYKGDGAPGWLVEGIADYARDRYGVDNAASGWALPLTLKPGDRHDSGYRVTGAFLKWAESGHPGLVKALDKALRDGHYAPVLWRRLTGKDIHALWQSYAIARTVAT